jgi:preprotein translocase subunit SecD
MKPWYSLGMNLNIKQLVSAVFSALLLSSSTIVFAENLTTDSSKNNARSSSKASTKVATTAALPNGLYLVFDESDQSQKLNPVGKQQVIVYDYEFFPESDRDAATYLTISPEEFIPLSLAVEPQKEKDTQGKPKLMLQLANDQITPLEEFTTKNLGKAVAIVIGSKVVTKHKIKEAIKGGKMQITRCSDNGCEILYTQLKQNR